MSIVAIGLELLGVYIFVVLVLKVLDYITGERKP